MNRGLILGFFDGVHVAHQTVILSAVNYARKTSLITFKESPSVYFNLECEYIYPREKSVEKIKSLGVDEVVELDFPQIADMNADDYIKFLIDKYNPVSISTGFNHTFGKNKSGNPELLRACSTKYGYKYFCIEPQEYEGEVVSSTLIKKYLKEGKIEIANRLLGSNFCLEGEVVHGAQIGRTIGFPTANISYPKDIVKIPFGVYSGLVGERHAMINWGMKPTVNNTKEPVVEVHILGYEGDLYGKVLEVEILKKIRDEKKFNSLEELREQIEKDKSECLKS